MTAGPVGTATTSPATLDPARGRARLVRAAALGGSSLLLAAGAHLLGGGALPPAGIQIVVALLVGMTAVTLTRRRCRLPLLLTVVGLQQVLMHYVFDLTGAATLDTTCLAASHHAMAHGCWSPTSPAMAGDQSGWVMLAAHVGAVAATAWLLARGEAWVWRVADQIVAAASARPGAWSVPVWDRLVGRPPVAVLALAYAPAAPRGPPVG